MEWLKGQFELSRGGAGSLPMEGLRGFAVFLVFLVHYASQSAPWTGQEWFHVARDFEAVGSIGVDLFFVLSGYLIYGSLIAKAQPFARFMWRRIQRIYPTFLAVFAVYLALSIALPSQSKIPDTGAALYLLQNLLMLPGMVPSIEPMITVAWSLSFEMFFYLSVPLIVGVLRLRSWRRDARLWFFAAVALVFAFTLGADHVRMVMFVGGMIVYELTQTKSEPPLGLGAWLAGIIMLQLPISEAFTGRYRLVLLLACAVFLCWHCFAARSSLTRALSWTPLRWLGNMSYSYYLIHGLTLKCAFMVLGVIVAPGPDLFWLLLVPMFAATLIPSAALFVMIERPFSLVQRKKADLLPIPHEA
jgi:exopolysaccharide production protein ExoZ